MSIYYILRKNQYNGIEDIITFYCDLSYACKIIFYRLINDVDNDDITESIAFVTIFHIPTYNVY